MKNIEFFWDNPLSFEKISETFFKAFGSRLEQKYWEWRFKENPNDDKILISYIIENKELASYYAVSPCTLILPNGNKEKIALSNMTMTHPNHQGKGHFRLIAQALYDSLKADGYYGVFGFANANSHYAFRKYLNWHDLAALNIISLKSSDFRDYLIKSRDFNFNITEVTEQISHSAEQMVFQNKGYRLSRFKKDMMWRLANHPTNQYKTLTIYSDKEIVGILFFKHYGNEIDLMEWFYLPDLEKEKFEIFGNAIKYLLGSGSRGVNLWSNVHSEEHLFLEKIGFNETHFNTYFGIIPFVEDESLLRLENWHYRFFDSDVF